MILRMAKRDLRTKIKGRLGGAIHLKTMAEMIRRMGEFSLDIQMVEEDEAAFGGPPSDIKKRVYGSNRILDGDRNVANEYMRQYQLDYGVRARFYVEGDTEYGALGRIIGAFPAVELVNLAGNVAQKRGKGVAFRDNLSIDLKSQIFSIVMIDGDRPDWVRVVRRAAENDLICGTVIISEPDIEFANFNIDELEEILLQMATEYGASTKSKDKLCAAIGSARNGDELWEKAHSTVPELRQSGKDEGWGRRLMEFAQLNPEITDAATGSTETRPIIEAANFAVRCIHYNYAVSRSKYRIDPGSLRIIERKQAGEIN